MRILFVKHYYYFRDTTFEDGRFLDLLMPVMVTKAATCITFHFHDARGPTEAALLQSRAHARPRTIYAMTVIIVKRALRQAGADYYYWLIILRRFTCAG